MIKMFASVKAPAESEEDGGVRFGTSVAGAGDLNGDGYADLVVGASGGGVGAEGAAYVFLGTVSN